MYLCKDACVYAVHHLQQQHYSLEPTQLILLTLKYNIQDFFPHAFEQLISACINNISDEEHHAVGSVVWNMMFNVKEHLDVHRQIIACKAPPMVHAGTYKKQNRCKEDWKQLWNGMGRFLLDG
jgi:hypothetical protein